MTPMLYIIGSILSCAFILFGWNTQGYISNICLIVGGIYFGHLLTEALNFVERPFNDNEEG